MIPRTACGGGRRSVVLAKGRMRPGAGKLMHGSPEKALHVRWIKHNTVNGLVLIRQSPAIHAGLQVAGQQRIVGRIDFFPKGPFAVGHVCDLGTARHVQTQDVCEHTRVLADMR